MLSSFLKQALHMPAQGGHHVDSSNVKNVDNCTQAAATAIAAAAAAAAADT